MMDILMSEPCWAHKKWNKIASDIKLVFHSSTITMMHGPINISIWKSLYAAVHFPFAFLPEFSAFEVKLVTAMCETGTSIHRHRDCSFNATTRSKIRYTNAPRNVMCFLIYWPKTLLKNINLWSDCQSGGETSATVSYLSWPYSVPNRRVTASPNSELFFISF